MHALGVGEGRNRIFKDLYDEKGNFGIPIRRKVILNGNWPYSLTCT